MPEENKKPIKYALVEALNRTYLWAYTADDKQILESHIAILDEKSRIIDYDVSEETACKVPGFKRRAFQDWLKESKEADVINIGEIPKQLKI